jgi:hypothetical protein
MIAGATHAPRGVCCWPRAPQPVPAPGPSARVGGAQALQDAYGGWASPRIVADYAAYAEAAFTQFGPRVQRWCARHRPSLCSLRDCMHACRRLACQAHSQRRHASRRALGHAGPGALDAGEQAAQSSQGEVHSLKHANSAVPGLGPGATPERRHLCAQAAAAAAPAHGTYICMQLLGLG